MHLRELRRELRLLALGHEASYPLAASLSRFFTDLDATFWRGLRDERLASALLDGDDDLDLTITVPARSGDDFQRFIELLELADAFCRQERLLTLARTPEPDRLPDLDVRGVRPADPRRRRRCAGGRRAPPRAGTRASRDATGARRPPRCWRWRWAAPWAAPCAGGWATWCPTGPGFPWTTFAINVTRVAGPRPAARRRGRAAGRPVAGGRPRAGPARRLHHALDVRRAGTRRCSPTAAAGARGGVPARARSPPAWSRSPSPAGCRPSRRRSRTFAAEEGNE